MTDKGLYWFKCKRCYKRFMAYIYGRTEYRDGDIYFVPHEYEEFRVYRNDINDADIGSYLYPITTTDYICNVCRKGYDLNTYIDRSV